MKIQFRVGAFIYLPLILSGFSFGCMKATTPPSGPVGTGNSITKIIGSISNATFFDSLIHKTGLDSTLNGTGPFTVFVATDTAFELAGINSTVISNTADSVLYRWATYAVIYGLSIGATNLPSGPDAKIITAGGDSIYVSNNINGIYVNGITVMPTELDASNGVINTVLHPLVPPSGTLLQTLASDTSYSFMAAAIARASQGSTDLDSLLTASPFTIFVPTNSSFQAAGFPTIADINNADPDSLAKIVTYHIVPQRIFSSDFTLVNDPHTLNGSSLQILQNTSPAVKGNSNSVPAPLVSTNIMASNGVIHTISGVLLP